MPCATRLQIRSRSPSILALVARASLNTALPALAEVRLSLFIDETLGWLLPLQFCIGQILTAKEIVRKITDGFWFLESWSHAHSRDARAHLRFEDFRSERTTKSRRKPLI